MLFVHYSAQDISDSCRRFVLCLATHMSFQVSLSADKILPPEHSALILMTLSHQLGRPYINPDSAFDRSTRSTENGYCKKSRTIKTLKDTKFLKGPGSRLCVTPIVTTISVGKDLLFRCLNLFIEIALSEARMQHQSYPRCSLTLLPLTGMPKSTRCYVLKTH